MPCPSCGESFSQYGSHWNQSSCEYPTLTDYQKDVVAGILMGDGCLHMESGRNCSLEVKMISKEYLKYLTKEVFGILSTDVCISRTAEEQARHNVESGFNIDADSSDYNDIYRLLTRRLPELNEYKSWYKSERKVFPDDLKLTPTVLTHWFVCDGTYNKYHKSGHISIGITNEMENKEKIEDYFTSGPEVSISNWSIYERDDGSKSAKIEFDVEGTKDLFNYMRMTKDPIPVPGFEYKWPNRKI